MSWTTTQLLAAVRRRAKVPDAGSAGAADDELLQLADDETLSVIVPLIKSCRENYFVKDLDVPLVAGQISYRIPPRAAGGQLRDVFLVAGDGTHINLDRIDENDLPNYAGQTGATAGFLLSDAYLTLFPTPDGVTAYSLRLKHHRRPNQLVLPSAVLSSSGIASGVISTAGGVPKTFLVGTLVDLVKATSPYDTLAIDVPLTAVGGSSVSIATANVPADFAAGDYVCLAEQSPVPQFPRELHPLLVQLVRRSFLGSDGDSKAIADADKTIERLTSSALDLLTPRVDGEVEVLAPNSFFPVMEG